MNPFKRFIRRTGLGRLLGIKAPPPEEKEFLGYALIGDGAKLKIGKRVSFGGNVLFVLNESIEIGDDTMIAINTVFHTSTHEHTSHPMWEFRIDRPISVGKHVWIGVGAIILAGVIIEDFAVIAAGSVVTNNVPKGAIVGGNPARILKYRDKASYEREASIADVGLGRIIKGGYLEKISKEK
jgi:acetyltransferase-like isoleucine patch superfamily enzyme